jgi:hypothetical protein
MLKNIAQTVSGADESSAFAVQNCGCLPRVVFDVYLFRDNLRPRHELPLARKLVFSWRRKIQWWSIWSAKQVIHGLGSCIEILTVSNVKPTRSPTAALIMVSPLTTAVARPLEVMVATDVFTELQ